MHAFEEFECEYRSQGEVDKNIEPCIQGLLKLNQFKKVYYVYGKLSIQL